MPTFQQPNRRTALQIASSVLAGTMIGSTNVFAAEPEIVDTRVISQTPDLYCGWPTLTRQQSGRLLLVWSGGREAHVCPFGRVEIMQSDDDGKTWTWPRTLLDNAIDDRDAGIVQTAKGSLLVTTFSSLAYDDYYLKKVVGLKPGDKGAWPKEKLDRWLSVHNRLNQEQRKAELGQWMIRSTDGGITWSERYPSIVNSPHGPIQLSDGRLLYAGKQLWEESKRVGVCQSKDDGVSWQWLAEIPVADGHSMKNYHELHAVECDSGRLIVHIRNQNKLQDRETLQSESADGGKTWSTPHPIGVWGLPSFLMKLRDGRLMMSYGYRRKPYGNQARISDDDGQTWSPPITISSDGTSGDLGYPTTVQLADDSLLTVWYEKMAGSSKAVLRQCHWKLPSS